MKVLHLIPHLGFGGSAKQMSLLVGGLPAERFEVAICGLGKDGPVGQQLRERGLRVEALDWHRLVDPGALLRLFKLVRDFQPDIVHAWEPAALQMACLCRAWHKSHIILSSPLVGLEVGRPGWLTRRALRRVERLLVAGAAEAQECQRRGIVDKLLQVPLGVEAAPAAVDTAAARQVLAAHGVDPAARLIVCLGPLEAGKGFRDAVWSFDILRFLFQDLRLLVIGEGSRRPELEEFIRASRTGELVKVLGTQPDVAPFLELAEMVWVPTHGMRGRNAALEALAASRPVVASRVGNLAEIIEDGVTGFLIPVSDKAALARQTRVLLDDAELCRRMGAAGRQRAVDKHAVAEMVSKVAGVYEAGHDRAPK